MVHIEVHEARGAEGMAAMDHDPWDTVDTIVVLLTERTAVLIKKFAGEFVDFFSIEVRWVFSLFEEESGRVLKFFHNSNIINQS